MKLMKKELIKYVVLQKKAKGFAVVCGSKTSTDFSKGVDYYIVTLGWLQIDVFWLVTF